LGIFIGMSYFEGDINFCPECGNILPIPGIQDFITCPRCAFNIPVRDLSGHVIKSSVVFNSLEKSSSVVEREEDGELKGPVIDRRCSRCNKEGMVYHTRQMRSADEGQTVFFTCIHCRYQEKEDS
ncbi:DNA-directed RNA polymerase I subunit RPA12 isoform X1, partial [Silurus meridionalis]